MAVGLKFKVDTRGFRRFIREAEKQSRFATSKAINAVALKAQDVQRRHQRRIFDVRNKRFVDRAVKIKPFAKKTSLSAVIGIDPPGGQSRADIIDKFEDRRRKEATGKHVAVPVNLRRSSRGVPKRFRPKALGFKLVGSGPKGTVYQGADRTFLVEYPDGRGFIFQARKRGGPKLLYVLVPHSVQIEPELDFERNVVRTVRRHWEREFRKAWAFAMRTAR